MPDGAGNTTATDYWTQLQNLGAYEYTKLYPEVFQYGYRWWKDSAYNVPTDLQSAYAAFEGVGIAREAGTDYADLIADLKSEVAKYTSSEETYVRWFLQNRIKKLQYEAEMARRNQLIGSRLATLKIAKKEQAAIEAGWIPPEGMTVGEARLETLRQSIPEAPAYEAEAFPIPDWMRPYLEPSIPAIQSAEGTLTPKWASVQEATAMLRPLGAQAELPAEQLGQMAGYLSFAKAGAPAEYSKEALLKIADWEGKWEEYTTLSQKLFPTQQTLRSRWRTAFQR